MHSIRHQLLIDYANKRCDCIFYFQCEAFPMPSTNNVLSFRIVIRHHLF